MQDEIVARLANQLSTQLIAAEARRAEQAPSPDSIDLYFQGMSCINKGWTADNVTQAAKFFELAVRRDPANVDALVGAAFANYVQRATYLAEQSCAALRSGEPLTSALLRCGGRPSLSEP